ncbi:cytochrome P450 (plasmid) [Streptomyces sp. BI20]|uniref:cytochrome P450 n=1 Tax=Streptomyces sp. BI20 TaxID=3403460 RepID=UPI003C7561DF
MTSDDRTDAAASPATRLLDPALRPDPYPLFAELRATPVRRDPTGVWLISTFHEIQDLLHDPRVSSDARNLVTDTNGPLGPVRADDETFVPSFLTLDPPEHDRLRRLADRPFAPPHSPHRVEDMREDLARIVGELLDDVTDLRDAAEAAADGDPGLCFDLVERVSYPFPVTVICRLLGVPLADEPRFRTWADTLVNSTSGATPEERRAGMEKVRAAVGALREYLGELISERRAHPGDDLLSHLALGGGTPETTLTHAELVSTAVLLLIAGHETTVNLIGNGMLTLLRHPRVLAELRADPDLAPRVVEETLRYEPPVQFVPTRTALVDIEVHGVTIPRGEPIWLLLAAGNRDPLRFTDPDTFDPGRPDLQHLGFGSGIHACYGAPLARLEARVALTELARRVTAPRIRVDPPPYRPSPVLRGPRHLLIHHDGVN